MITYTEHALTLLRFVHHSWDSHFIHHWNGWNFNFTYVCLLFCLLIWDFVHSSYHNSCFCHKFVHLWFRIAVYGLSRGSGLGRLCPNHVGATAPMVDHYFPPPPLTHHHRILRLFTLPFLSLNVPFLRVLLLFFSFFLFLADLYFIFPFLEIKNKDKRKEMPFFFFSSFFFLPLSGGLQWVWSYKCGVQRDVSVEF